MGKNKVGKHDKFFDSITFTDEKANSQSNPAQNGDQNQINEQKPNTPDSPKYPPKFHLEPIPTEFHPDNVNPREMTSQEFVAKFRAMRNYMKARRKVINQDE